METIVIYTYKEVNSYIRLENETLDSFACDSSFNY